MLTKTPKPGGGITGDVFGQLMKTVKQTGKTAKSQLAPAKFLQAVTQQFGGGLGVGEKKAIPPVQSPIGEQEIQGMPVTDLTNQQFDQIKRQRDLQSMRRYREIQQAIVQYRQQKQQEAPKQVSGQAGFEPERAGQPPAPVESASLTQPTAKKKRGFFGGLGRRVSQQQKQNLGTREVGKTRSG